MPDQLSSYTPVKGVTRKAVTAPTWARRCALHFSLDTFPSQVHVDKPSTR